MSDVIDIRALRRALTRNSIRCLSARHEAALLIWRAAEVATATRIEQPIISKWPRNAFGKEIEPRRLGLAGKRDAEKGVPPNLRA
jgi:hypothetical protein